MKKQELSPKEISQLCFKIADARQAGEITELDMHNLEVTAIADYFLVCTGNSDPHLRAISGTIEKELRNEYNIRPRAVEGSAASGWIIIDYFSVVIHVLNKEMREMYEIENLWGDVPRITNAKDNTENNITS